MQKNEMGTYRLDNLPKRVRKAGGCHFRQIHNQAIWALLAMVAVQFVFQWVQYNELQTLRITLNERLSQQREYVQKADEMQVRRFGEMVEQMDADTRAYLSTAYTFGQKSLELSEANMQYSKSIMKQLSR